MVGDAGNPTRIMKVTVYIPSGLIEELDAHSKRLNRTRNELIVEAVEGWLERNDPTTAAARYIAGYERYPELIDPETGMRVGDSWDDLYPPSRRSADGTDPLVSDTRKAG